MAGSVKREYEIVLIIKTNHYEEELSDIITETLEEVGIDVEDITVN